MVRPWSVGVVIPARDEAATIAACVASVLRSLDGDARVGNTYVVVVADACTDRTPAIAARAIGTRGEVVMSHARCVGTARQRGTERVLGLLGAGPRTWLANTDADTVVPKDWIRHQLDCADRGVAAVAGLVVLGGEADERLQRRFDQTYEIPEHGGHPHVHGANLGVRADALVAVGGWHHKGLAEDHCLWNRLRTRWPSESIAAGRVSTSARLKGRAPGGFADTLARVAE